MNKFAEPVIPGEAAQVDEIRNLENHNDVAWRLVPRLRGDVVWIPARVPLCGTWPG